MMRLLALVRNKKALRRAFGNHCAPGIFSETSAILRTAYLKTAWTFLGTKCILLSTVHGSDGLRLPPPGIYERAAARATTSMDEIIR